MRAELSGRLAYVTICVESKAQRTKPVQHRVALVSTLFGEDRHMNSHLLMSLHPGNNVALMKPMYGADDKQ